MFTKSLLLGALAAFAAAQSTVISFTSVPGTIEAGKAQTIGYTTQDTSSPVTITLRKGESNNLQTISTLTSDSTGGSYSWTPDTSLENGSDYALEITQGGQTNYYGPFSITGASASGSSSYGSSSSSSVSGTTSTSASASTYSSAAANITSSTTVSTAAGTIGTITAGTGTAMSRNTTMSTATLSTATSTGAVYTTAATTTGGSATEASSSASATATSGASAKVGSAALSVLFGAAAVYFS